MDRSPPPFFKQGPSANARVIFFALLSLAIMVVDSQMNTLAGLRQGIGNVLYPAQRTAQVPRDMMTGTADYFTDVAQLRADNAELRRVEALNARALLQIEQLAEENRQLRALSGARERSTVRSTLAEVLYETRDPYSRRLVLDKGLNHQIAAGQPVIDAQGLVGQVTRVFQFSSEMTLVTDRDFTVPVQIQCTGLRTVAFGDVARGGMELRYLAGTVDIREGDRLVTSGLDKLYPAGLPVGRVASVERGASNEMIKVRVEPTAAVQNDRMLVVLQVDTSNVPPAPSPDGDDSTRKRAARR